MNESMIDIARLEFSYPQKKVFSQVDLSVKRGQIFTLLGPNGCGKTTLIHCILNHLKPQIGEIRIAGTELSQIRPAELARKISYVPQNHKKVFPYTVKEVVLMGRTAYIPGFGVPGTNDRNIAEQAMELLGISDLANRPFPFLSGGESQLVLLARSIAQQSEIIILDEPTAHLDSFHELLVLDKLMELMRQNDLTILMTTHVPNQALYLMNHGAAVAGALMKEGRIIAADTGEALITEENISKLYDIECRMIRLTAEGETVIRQLVPLGTLASGQKKNTE